MMVLVWVSVGLSETEHTMLYLLPLLAGWQSEYVQRHISAASSTAAHGLQTVAATAAV